MDVCSGHDLVDVHDMGWCTGRMVPISRMICYCIMPNLDR